MKFLYQFLYVPRKRFILRSLGVIFLATCIPVVGANVKDKKGPLSKAKKADLGDQQLARVSILPFEDRTNSQSYRYLSGSLSDAINRSMQKGFEYKRINPKDVTKTLWEIRQKKKRNDLTNKILHTVKNKAEIEEQKRKDTSQLELVKKFAKTINSDIVIFGNYIYDNETREVVFITVVYYALSNSVVKLEATRNAVDGTLFRATKVVAKQLVIEIQAMAQDATDMVLKKEGSNKEELARAKPKTKGGKVVLTREMAKTATYDWNSKKFSLSIAPAFYMHLPPVQNNQEFCGTCQAQVGITARFWVMPFIYLGGKIDYSQVWSDTVALGDSYLIDAFFVLGYGLPIARMLLSAEAGAGYFVLSDKTIGLIYNPAFNAKFGIEFLLSPSYSIGVAANVIMYYDEPKPILYGGLAVSVSYVL